MLLVLEDNNGNPVDYKYSIGKLKADNRNTSFPSEIPDSVLHKFRCFRLEHGIKPDHDPGTQKLIRASPEKHGNSYKTSFQVVQK